MSHLADTRAAFKAALDTVDGVNGYPYQPAAPTAGDAWPVMGTAQRDEESGAFGVDWYVVAYLPQDQSAASVWIDTHVDDIIDAIEHNQVAFVDAFDPVNLNDDSGAPTIYALLLTMRSE